MLQAEAWFSTIFRPEKEIIITALPLYHVFSLTANCLFLTKIGGLNILVTNPRDIPAFVAELKKFKFTIITGVNTLFHALINNPDFAKLDFSRLKLALGGGMAVQRSVAEEWQRITGVPILEAYGLTETSPCACINPVTIKSYNGTVGFPVSSTDCCILANTGQELPINQPGELAIKGPQVMAGYWRNPGETQKSFTKDGWLLTGDIATIDEEGYVRILERKKDMILVSGFNVYPNEIEDVLVRMPGILEAAVIGVADDNSTEVVKAFIVKKDPALTENQVLKYCRENLTPYKIPKHIEFCKELPKTNVGKILRRALKPKSGNEIVTAK
jgi:long-chain acyl-CoA synthetase